MTNSATLKIDNTDISGNEAPDGPAISNTGILAQSYVNYAANSLLCGVEEYLGVEDGKTQVFS